MSVTVQTARQAEAALIGQLDATAAAIATVGQSALDAAVSRVRAEAAALRARVDAARAAVSLELLGVAGCLATLAADLGAGLALPEPTLPAPAVEALPAPAPEPVTEPTVAPALPEPAPAPEVTPEMVARLIDPAEWTVEEGTFRRTADGTVERVSEAEAEVLRAALGPVVEPVLPKGKGKRKGK